MPWSIWRLTVLFTGLLVLAPIAPRRVPAATLTVTDLGDTGAAGQL